MIGGFAAGLGIITKGVGILPYLIFVPYAFAVAQRWSVVRHSWRDWRWAAAPAATLLAVALWLVPMLLATIGGSRPGVDRVPRQYSLSPNDYSLRGFLGAHQASLVPGYECGALALGAG